MAGYDGSTTAGHPSDNLDMRVPGFPKVPGLAPAFPKVPNLAKAVPRIVGASQLFQKKYPGSPGKLGKSSTKAESLSKLRGKGALA